MTGRSDAELAEQVGMPPQMATVPTPFGGYETPQQIAAGQGGRTTKSAARLNLRAVADVLETYGLDPIEEVAKALVRLEPVLDRSGNKVLGEDGKPLMRPAVDGDTRLRTLLELAQYSRAKLKAIEVTHKGPELTDEQIDARLKALMERNAKS